MTSGQAYLLLCAFGAALALMLVDPIVDEVGDSLERSSRIIREAGRL
jgi:hypothetical protein